MKTKMRMHNAYFGDKIPNYESQSAFTYKPH